MRLFAGALPSVIAATAVAGLKISYYSDGGCSSRQTCAFPFTDNRCYNYVWWGVDSANIANCEADICICKMYTEANCQGTKLLAASIAGNCASMGPRIQVYEVYSQLRLPFRGLKDYASEDWGMKGSICGEILSVYLAPLSISTAIAGVLLPSFTSLNQPWCHPFHRPSQSY